MSQAPPSTPRPAESPDIPRILAFYLPQFSPIPENDAWWGPGFTEWTNVRQGRPLFPGHEQPHVPAGSVYYDLRDPAVLDAQVDMARAHGLHGFVFYHYWFGGKRLLDLPVRHFMDRNDPSFPFCLCWANESWTRRWDGLEQEVLLEQTYSPQDDLEHIRTLLPLFRHPSYLRVDDRPVFLVYRTETQPDPAATAAMWRAEARKVGIKDLFLLRVESLAHGIDPMAIGFDGAVEFAPDWRTLAAPIPPALLPLGPDSPDTLRDGRARVFDYQDVLCRTMSKDVPTYPFFRGAFPGWDNTARRRRGQNPTIIHNSTPQAFQRLLEFMLLDSSLRFPPDRRLIFVNAWNEWGEGCHLEPDERHGQDYLLALSRAKANTRRSLDALDTGPGPARLQALHRILTKGFRQDLEALFHRRAGLEAAAVTSLRDTEDLAFELADLRASLGWRVADRASRTFRSLFPETTTRGRLMRTLLRRLLGPRPRP